MSDDKVKLGEIIFNSISENEYLNKLYKKALLSYAQKTLSMPIDNNSLNSTELHDLLRFADLLSKSNHATKYEEHKMWAQEIIVLLNFLFPDNKNIKAFGGSVFSNTDNTRGISILNTDFEDPFILSRLFQEYKKSYLRIPAQEDMHFFSAQKQAYDHLNDKYLSLIHI